MPAVKNLQKTEPHLFLSLNGKDHSSASLWGGMFRKNADDRMNSFSESISFDFRLYKEDIEGSIAHCRMLANQKIISKNDSLKIIRGLLQIRREIESETFIFRKEQEDIHMNIESALIKKIGKTGEKLHTARSRNDQITLDMKLYMRRQIEVIMNEIIKLQRGFLKQCSKYRNCPLPGYTHLQHAQPVLLAHYFLAYVEMLERDYGRFSDCRRRMDELPLGAGALAGTTLPINRKYVARILGFSRVSGNTMDTVGDRDFVIECVSACSLLMMHLSRFAEEMVLWSTREFGFLTLPDEFSTGSSLMPQKKNPDVFELIRGKTGQVYGALTALLTIMKALPLSYNRDMQEDKIHLFRSIDTVHDCLNILASVIPALVFNRSQMQKAAGNSFLLATDAVDYLVGKGIPFREAHHSVGKAVLFASVNSIGLDEIPVNEWKRMCPASSEDIKKIFNLNYSFLSHRSDGATSPVLVDKQIACWNKKLKSFKS